MNTNNLTIKELVEAILEHRQYRFKSEIARLLGISQGRDRSYNWYCL